MLVLQRFVQRWIYFALMTERTFLRDGIVIGVLIAQS
jgi:hypothetical protein